MSDFSKKAKPVTPTDDQAPIPALGQAFSVTPDVDTVTGQSEDDKQTDRAAAPYWHPAWETVQERFEELLETYGNPANATIYRDFPDDEFKIRMLTEATVHQELTKIMEDVKRAVESVESRPKPAKQPKSGA